MPNTLQTKQQVMAEQIKNLCKSQDEIKDDLKDYITEDRAWKESLLEKLDKKYAGKFVEVISIGCLLSILGQLIAKII